MSEQPRQADEAVVAAIESLGERVLELRQTVWTLKNEVQRLRPYEAAIESSTALRRDVVSVLAAITWADDLEEARDIASRALAGDLLTHVQPPSDDTSIDQNDQTSKDQP